MQFTLVALLLAGLAAALPQETIGNTGCYIREATEKTCAAGFPRECVGSSGTTTFPYCCRAGTTLCDEL
jgi:hypothetical protein